MEYKMQLQTTYPYESMLHSILKLPRQRQEHLKLLVLLHLSQWKRIPIKPSACWKLDIQPLHLLQLLRLVLLPGTGAAFFSPDP
jgi:hypothetical protein